MTTRQIFFSSWLMIVVQLGFMFSSGVLGFQSPAASTLIRTTSFRCYYCRPISSSSHRLQIRSSLFATHTIRSHHECPPTVQNPVSKRQIQLGGPKFRDFIKQGLWVQHEGTLQQLDLKALSDYQQIEGMDSAIETGDKAANKEESNRESNTDEWYGITPSVVVAQKDGTRKLTETEAALLKQQLLFVHKPSGFHCVPSRDLSEPSLSVQVAEMYPGAKPCHRLDRDTSGIVIFGLTADTHRDISMQFEARTTSKTYMALIAGHPDTTNDNDQQYGGTINMPIGKQKTEEGFNRWAIGGEKQREAVTNWRSDSMFTDAVTGAKFSRVILTPLTGRGHQLRLHMKAIGCPILGDTIHGEGEVATCAPRLCLHAQKVQVDWNGLRLEAECVTPF
jgi:tRNA pseudouridine32 synthase/23S rRNA pseudouridine746 synthase